MKKIGFFDSGVGGISVLHEGIKQISDAEFLYYADTDHVPYGNRSREEIETYVEEAVAFLVNRGIDALVVACNTATSVSVRKLRKMYDFPIVGMEPAVKLALKLEPQKKILVAATDVTVHGEKLQLLLERFDKKGQAETMGLGGLVLFAERNEFEGEEVLSYLKSRLEGRALDEIGAVVFGCTHFGYFKDSFQKLFPEGTKYVDGNEGTIRHLKNLLGISKEEKGEYGKADVTYFKSGVQITEEKELEWIQKLHRRLNEL